MVTYGLHVCMRDLLGKGVWNNNNYFSNSFTSKHKAI